MMDKTIKTNEEHKGDFETRRFFNYK